MAEPGPDLRGLVDALQDVAYVLRLDPDVGFEFVSDAVTALVGYTPAEHYADPDLGGRIVDPRDLPTLARLAVAPVGTPVEATLRWVSRDGREIWTQHRCVKRRRADGSVALYGSARDVTASVEDRQALAAAREEFRLLAENAADVVVRIDAHGDVVWVSPSAHRLLGYEPADLLGRPRVDLLHPFDLARVRTGMETWHAGRVVTVTEEVRLRRRDGVFSWWQATARRTGDDPGRSDVVIALRDIDAEVAARAAADAEQQRRASVVQSMLDPHVLLRVVHGRSGQIIDFTVQDGNDAACEAFALPFDQLVGSRLSRLAPGLETTELFSRCVDAVQTGIPLVVDDAEVRTDRGQLPARVDVRAVRLGGEALSVTWRDVSDRHAAAVALAESEARYRLLADNVGDVVLATDAAEAITYVSPSVARVLGWTPQDLNGTRLLDLIHPEDLPAVTGTRAAAAQAADGVGTGRARVRRKDGSYRWISSVVRQVRDAAGTPVRIVAAWREGEAAEPSTTPR